MNYQSKENLTFNKKRIQRYGGGDQYEGGDIEMQKSNLLLVEGGFILKVEDNDKLLKVSN